jgi:hypothetical protein
LLNNLLSSKLIFLILCCLIFLTFYGISLGQILGDLGPQIFMADAFLNFGYFYPDTLKENIGSVSIYAPGISFISLALTKVGLDKYIFESMLLVASSALILLIYLLSIASSSFYNNQDKMLNFSIFLIFVLLFCDLYIMYALEFRPDTISLCIGVGILLLTYNLDASKKCNMIVLGTFFSMGLLFKQQYIAVILAMTLYCFLINKSWRYFGIGNLLGFSIISYALLNIEGFSYWAIDIISDDGFFGIMQYLSASIDFYYAVIGILILLYFFKIYPIRLDLLNKKLFLFELNSIDLLKNPFSWFVSFSAAAALAGSFKVGGNSGNGEIAILLITTIFIGIFKLPKQIKSNVVLALSLLIILPKGFLGYVYYFDIIESRSKVISVLKDYNYSNIAYDKSQYFLIRGEINDKNYWDINSYRLKQKEFMSYDEGYNSFVSRYQPDIILLRSEKKNSTNNLGYKTIYSDKNLLIRLKLND